jgi:alanine racemase
MNRKATLHIKVDTGLNRLGFQNPEEVLSVIKKIISHRRHLTLEGIYSHLASVEDQDRSYTSDQVLAFEKILKKINAQGIEIPIISLAASAAAIMLPDTRFNCVRIGIAIYGIWPSRGVELWSKRSKRTRSFKLRPALSYRSRLISVKRVKAGSQIGYGCNFTAPNAMTIGVIAAGYYEGVDRSLSNIGFALLKGAVVPMVGRICMNMTILDISKRPRAKIGDEVVLIGKSLNKEITAWDVADWSGTISYETLARIPEHIPRIYK